jgi:ketosteroid isomerase-like protein
LVAGSVVQSRLAIARQRTEEAHVDTLEFVRDITFKMCDRDFDLDLVESTFAEDFVHHGNGATSDKAGYLARGREYRERFATIDRPEFDELFAVDDRVVVAYTLQLHRNDGGDERMAVMAIWTVRGGKVVELREVDAPAV